VLPEVALGLRRTPLIDHRFSLPQGSHEPKRRCRWLPPLARLPNGRHEPRASARGITIPQAGEGPSSAGNMLPRERGSIVVGNRPNAPGFADDGRGKRREGFVFDREVHKRAEDSLITAFVDHPGRVAPLVRLVSSVSRHWMSTNATSPHSALLRSLRQGDQLGDVGQFQLEALRGC